MTLKKSEKPILTLGKYHKLRFALMLTMFFMVVTGLLCIGISVHIPDHVVIILFAVMIAVNLIYHVSFKRSRLEKGDELSELNENWAYRCSYGVMLFFALLLMIIFCIGRISFSVEINYMTVVFTAGSIYFANEFLKSGFFLILEYIGSKENE